MIVHAYCHDDIAVFLRDNPNVGRVKIANRFGLGDKEARKYAALGSFMALATEEVIAREDLETVRLDVEYANGDEGSVSAFGRGFPENFTREGAVEKTFKESGVKREEWIVHRVKRWTTPMKLRKRTGEKPHEYEDQPIIVANWLVELRPKPVVIRKYEEAFEKIVAKTRSISPIHKPKLPKKEMLAGLLEPADAHIAKHAWSKETLGGDMDLPISIQKFKHGCESDMQKMALHGISQMYFVLGHDMVHIDNRSGQTELGKHHLDYDSRYVKIIEQTEETLIKVIEQSLQIAPTKIIWVPGNHDFHASFHLCRTMMRRFENTKHATFDIGPSEKKMVVWGDNLIGLTHNAEGRKRVPTVNLLAQYDPWKQYWSQARFTELHTGHLHKRETMTVGGTLWRRIAALSTIDQWHANGVFTDAVPCCQSFIYHKKDGVYAEYPTNINYL